MTLRVPATTTFGACLFLAVATTVLALSAPDEHVALRLPATLLLACFVPGYLLLCTLFPTEEDMGHLLRFGLSLACSFPLIIFLALAVSAAPYYRSASGQILVMDGLLLVLGGAATWRQRREPVWRRLTYLFATHNGSLLRDRFAVASLLLAVVLAVVAITSFVGSNRDVATALSVPTGATPANPIQATSVTVQVESHETTTETFQISVSWQGQVIGRTAPFLLQPGQTTVRQVGTAPPPGQGPVPVDVALFKQGDIVPFRQLRVWMRTVPYRPPS